MEKKVISRRIYQRTVPIFLVSLLAGIFLVEYFFIYEPLTVLTDELSAWGSIITACTVLFGNIAVILIKARQLKVERTRKQIYDIVVFLGTALIFIILALAVPNNVNDENYLLLYTPLMAMMGTTLWTNAHLYYVWAVIQRLVRVRSLEIFVLALSCVLLIFYNTPSLVSMVPQFHPIGEWIVTVLNKAVQRATALCLAISGIVMMVRALAGKEPGLVEMEME